MKLFIVNFKNENNLLPFEPFYYEGIADGNISLFSKTLMSLSQLDEVRVWLETEINRNPFSIEQGIVVFQIPRNLTMPLDKEDYEVTALVYIRELVEKHFDGRFQFVCFFLDEVGKDENNDPSYNHLKYIYKNLCYSDLPVDDLPAIFKNEEEVLGDILICDKTQMDAQRINQVQDPVFREFYLNSLHEQLIGNRADKEAMQQAMTAFVNDCRAHIQHIYYYHVPYFGGDIAKKLRIMLIICDYLCKLAKAQQELPPFRPDDTTNDNSQFLKDYNIDLHEKAELVATYIKRLGDWLNKNKPHEELSDFPELSYDFDYETIDEFMRFRHYINDVMKRFRIRPGFKELAEFDVTEYVIKDLKQTLSESDKMLDDFCDVVVDNAFNWWRQNADYLSEGLNKDNMETQELKQDKKLLEAMNQFTPTRRPGYTEECAMLQDLEAINMRIKEVGARMKSYSPVAFAMTVLFSLASIGICYFVTQYSVFMKENTWSVYGIYLGGLAASFLLPYGILRIQHMRKIKKLLKLCEKRIFDFLEVYSKQAEEFGKNMKAAMNYYCFFTRQCKKAAEKEKHTEKHLKYLWHRPKMEAIITNLSCFKNLIQTENAKAVKENNIPPLKDFEDDAAHSKFYQMKIYN